MTVALQPAVGAQLGEAWTAPVERSKLRELAIALGETDPVWHDRAAARAVGFDDVPLLPTTTVIADTWRDGGFFVANVEAAGLDASLVLHGEVTWRYVLPIQIGDELTVSCHVTSVDIKEGRRGGVMKRVGIKTLYVNQHAKVVAIREDVLIEVVAR